MNFLANPVFSVRPFGKLCLVQLFSISTELYQHAFPFSSSRLSATDTIILSGVQLSIPSSVTYSQSPTGGLLCGDNIGGIEAVLCCTENVCAVRLLIRTVGNEKVRLTEMGQQTNCKAPLETGCLKTKRGFQLCSNFRINLRINQSLSSCHYELDAETLQRRGGGTTNCRMECIKNNSTLLKPKFETAICARNFNNMLTVFYNGATKGGCSPSPIKI